MWLRAHTPCQLPAVTPATRESCQQHPIPPETAAAQQQSPAPTSIFMATASPLRAVSTGLWSFSREAIRPRSTPPCGSEATCRSGRGEWNDHGHKCSAALRRRSNRHATAAICLRASTQQRVHPRPPPDKPCAPGLTRLGTQMGVPTLAMPSTTCSGVNSGHWGVSKCGAQHKEAGQARDPAWHFLRCVPPALRSSSPALPGPCARSRH